MEWLFDISLFYWKVWCTILSPRSKNQRFVFPLKDAQDALLPGSLLWKSLIKFRHQNYFVGSRLYNEGEDEFRRSCCVVRPYVRRCFCISCQTSAGWTHCGRCCLLVSLDSVWTSHPTDIITGALQTVPVMFCLVPITRCGAVICNWASNQRSCSAEVFSWNCPLKSQERGSESEVLLFFSWPAACCYRYRGNKSTGGIPVSPGAQTYISAGAPLTRRLRICYCDSVPTCGSVFPPERDGGENYSGLWGSLCALFHRIVKERSRPRPKRSPSCFRSACLWARMLNVSRRRVNPEWLKWPFGFLVCW